KPFQLVGYDSSTGLESFRIDHAGADALDPLNAIPTAIVSANDSGPYPVYATPARLEIATVPPEGVTLRSVRGLTIAQNSGTVTLTGATPALPPATRVEVLNVSNARSGSSTSISSGGIIPLLAAPGDRLLIAIGEQDVDPEQTIALAFSSRIDLGGATTDDQVDAFLQSRNWIQILAGDAGVTPTPVTKQAKFTADADARRVYVRLPLQRGKVYQIVVKGDLSGPPIGSTPGLKLGQRNIGGTLVPATPRDLTFEFTTRKPGGSIGDLNLPADRGGVRDFALIGNVALIATTVGGLQAFDVSDPAKLSTNPPPIRRVEGVIDYWSVQADRHGRIYAAGLGGTFGVVQSFRLEDFIDPPLPLKPIKPTGGTNVSWRVGVNVGMPLGTETLFTDRPEAIPRKLQVLVQDSEAPASRSTLLTGATNVANIGSGFIKFDVDVTVPSALQYYKQRITIENRTIGARWSADVQRGQSGRINSVVARDDDELYVVRNETTYGVVSLFGYGIGVFDLNAAESNDLAVNQPGYKEIQERVVLTAAKGEPRTDVVYPTPVFCDPSLPANTPCVCNPALTAPVGTACEIRDLTFSPDALIFPSVSTPNITVYAVDQRRGLLDIDIAPPRIDPGPPPVTRPATAMPGYGLSLSDPFIASSGSGNLYHPRLRSLRNLYLNNGGSSGIEPRARFTSISPYLRTDRNGNAQNYGLMAANNFGVMVVKIDGYPLTWSSLVDVIWIPAGALSVRVIPRSDLAVVIDNAGRVLLVDLRAIDESSQVAPLPACTNDLCVGELFPTAKKSINSPTPPLPPGADWIEVGVDDARIVWKTDPKTVIGNIAPVIDPDTGILLSGDINGNRVRAIAAIDPRIQFRIRTDDGPRFVNSIVPLGIAPRDPTTDPESSYGTFRIELTLPGSLVESLTSGTNDLRMAVESERIVGAVTEQTSIPYPPSHLRQRTRAGATDPRAGAALDQFKMQRLAPYNASDPQLKLLRYQKAYNRFVSPWIVAVADPRASEKYTWGSINRASQGCFACQRPQSLQGRNPPEAYELFARGRVIAVRPESGIFSGSPYQFLGDGRRLEARLSTIPADTLRSPEVLVA
ncbi:MAG TPA: hypothetical protein VGS96_06140, partial [Thermoanaerobaculia bacterium]|nr:hypothetical protein [Thermoanaerobaculia bacterium]